MAVEILGGFSYYSKETEFVKYFKRLKSIGMTFHEIEDKLPQLEKYYKEMVLDGVDYGFGLTPTLENLFNKWKYYNYF